MAVNGEVQLSKTQSPALLRQVEDGPILQEPCDWSAAPAWCFVLGLDCSGMFIERVLRVSCECAATVKVRSVYVRHAE